MNFVDVSSIEAQSRNLQLTGAAVDSGPPSQTSFAEIGSHAFDEQYNGAEAVESPDDEVISPTNQLARQALNRSSAEAPPFGGSCGRLRSSLRPTPAY